MSKQLQGQLVRPLHQGPEVVSFARIRHPIRTTLISNVCNLRSSFQMTAIVRTVAILTLFLVSISVYAYDSEEFKNLRDQGIKNIGWVAGNTEKTPLWPQLKPYVGQGGNYYDAFVRLKAPNEKDEAAAAMSNVGLYRKWKKIGAEQPFNEAEAMMRIQRTIQLSEEIEQMLR